MTVAELIEALERLPPDAVVACPDSGALWSPMPELTWGKVARGYPVCVTTEGDMGAVRMVVL